ncbi:YebY family protein [Providencia vermicola]|uniref:YebY family protein n=1 Tax=Providencia vermicola TaxID=333965 RepID=UPI0034DD754A
MKLKLALYSMLLVSTTFSVAAAPIETVSKKQFGDDWPFTREEVMLECRGNGALIVINPATLMQYPLNDVADSQMKNKEIKAQPIDVLLKPIDTQKATEERIQPLKLAAEKLCKKA